MVAKITIAIVASTKEKIQSIIGNIAFANHRLLLVSKHENLSMQLEEMQFLYPGVDVEIIECTKDGCWEADMIILDIPSLEQYEVAERIKEVSTQKIVVKISEESFADGDDLQKLLKNSKVVNVTGHSGSSKKVITGKDPEAVESVSSLFKKTKQPR
ncbi:MAG: hypothetical protein ABIY62_07525 [Ginsengibacter sp.]